MTKLYDQLGLRHDSSTPYYPQVNGQVDAVNKVLTTMIKRIVGAHKSNQHTMIFSALQAYRTSAKTTSAFTPFQLIYGLEVVLPIECEISSLKLAIELLPATYEEEKCFLYLAKLDETQCTTALAIEAQKKRVNAQYEQSVNSHIHSEGDIVLVYDQANNKPGVRKFEPICHGPYNVKRVIAKGSYELIYYDGLSLDKPRNGLYLKRYYA